MTSSFHLGQKISTSILGSKVIGMRAWEPRRLVTKSHPVSRLSPRISGMVISIHSFSQVFNHRGVTAKVLSASSRPTRPGSDARKLRPETSNRCPGVTSLEERLTISGVSRVGLGSKVRLWKGPTSDSASFTHTRAGVATSLTSDTNSAASEMVTTRRSSRQETTRSQGTNVSPTRRTTRPGDVPNPAPMIVMFCPSRGCVGVTDWMFAAVLVSICRARTAALGERSRALAVAMLPVGGVLVIRVSTSACARLKVAACILFSSAFLS